MANVAHVTTTTCDSCIFFEEHVVNAAQTTDDAGLCRFNPPVTQTEPDAHGLWPVVKADDWCGQFTAERH